MFMDEIDSQTLKLENKINLSEKIKKSIEFGFKWGDYYNYYYFYYCHVIYLKFNRKVQNA